MRKSIIYFALFCFCICSMELSASVQLLKGQTEKIREILSSSQLQLSGTIKEKSAASAKAPLEAIIADLEKAVALARSAVNYMADKKNSLTQNGSVTDQIQKYMELESDFRELETELNRLKRKVNDLKEASDSDEFETKLKNLDAIFSGLDKFLVEIEVQEKNISSN